MGYQRDVDETYKSELRNIERREQEFAEGKKELRQMEEEYRTLSFELNELLRDLGETEDIEKRKSLYEIEDMQLQSSRKINTALEEEFTALRQKERELKERTEAIEREQKERQRKGEGK